jgi:hypothetical protein
MKLLFAILALSFPSCALREVAISAEQESNQTRVRLVLKLDKSLQK